MLVTSKKMTAAILAITLAMSLSACSNWSKRDRNTAIGAGAGALGGAVLTDGSTLGTLVIFAIPLVGFIMMLVWSFSGGPDSARKRLARAYLVRTLIIAVIFALLFLIGALSLAAVSHSLYYALR